MRTLGHTQKTGPVQGAKDGACDGRVSAGLKEKLQRKLHDPRRHGAVLDLPEGAVRKVVDWRVKLRVIPDVVELGSELDAGPFRNLCRLHQGDIPVELAGPHDRTDAGVTEAGAAARTRAIALYRASDARR